MQNRIIQTSARRGLVSSGPRQGLALLAACLALGASLRADMVTDWNANAEQTILVAGEGPPIAGRSWAIVHAAIFDAVNGVQHKYHPYFVTERGPLLASPEAAAAQAAYTALVSLYPAQQAALNLELSNSLARLPNRPGSKLRIALGRLWGQYVAEQTLTWRSTDGATNPLPPYYGGGAPGIWRSPPAGTNADGSLPALFEQYAVLVPFAMTSHDQFRPGPPPDLTSALYAADVNEVKAIGRFDSAIRTSDQTQLALLWQAVGLAQENHAIRPVVELYTQCWDLVDTARLFALINIAGEDALIAGFDSKYTYNRWRPYHAIRLADTDGNPDTDPDPTWNSLFIAPRFQEYMSNHAAVTTAFMSTLAALIGDQHTFTLSSTAYPSFTWTFNSFSEAAAQVKEARIWAGIHFRHSCDVGAAQGASLSRYVLANFMRPLHDHWSEDEQN